MYESLFGMQEYNEVFYLPAFIDETNQIHLINEKDIDISIPIPMEWFGNKLTVVKTRPRKVYNNEDTA